MAEKTRVLVVDDHPLFREGLKAIVEVDGRYEVVAEAGAGREAVRLAKRCKPEVAVVDISLPDTDGIHVTRSLRELSPSIKVLIVTMHSDIDYVVESFRAGATGYMVKESAADRLLYALDCVTAGQCFLDGSASGEVVRKLMDAPRTNTDINDEAYSTLTPREQEVLRYLAEGNSCRDIAGILDISAKTAENHRGNLMRKLGLRNATELVRYAAKLGIIDLAGWGD